VDTQPTIRQLVEKALYYRQITPEIENGINEILGRLGYVSDVDYEAQSYSWMKWTSAGLIWFRVGNFSYQWL